MRGAAFEKKDGELAAAYPSDTRGANFSCAGVVFAASPLDKTFSNEKECGEILEPIFEEQPHHPGVAHYIIHCYDNPVLAQQGLGAARMYAKIAPVSDMRITGCRYFYASGIVGDESIASNIKSAEIAASQEQDLERMAPVPPNPSPAKRRSPPT